MNTPSTITEGRTYNALIAGIVVFLLASGVGAAVAWLAAQQEQERAQAAVSSTAAHYAGNLRAAMVKTTAATHAMAAVLQHSSDAVSTFSKTAPSLVESIGGVECLRWSSGGRVVASWPKNKCKELFGQDAPRIMLFRGGDQGALSGPIDLPNQQIAVAGRLSVLGAGATGTLTAVTPVAELVAEAKLLDLPGEGWAYSVVAPLQGARVLHASIHGRDLGKPIAEVPVVVDNVTFVLRMASSAKPAPLLGWAAATVFLIALLLARLGHGFVAQAASYHTEARLRKRLEARLEELQGKRKQLEESNARMTDADRITGLPTARYMSRYLDKNWLDFAMRREPVALMVVEIDRFDALFEAIGANKSESALRSVADVMRKQLTADDELLVRFRGTAFAIFFRNGARNPGRRAEQARADVAKLQIANPKSPVAKIVTVSIGVVHGVPGRHDPMRAFAQVAEDALSQARNEGHNRVTVRAWSRDSAARISGATRQET